MNTLTTLKSCRENVSDTLGFAHISQTQGDAISEAWWRGLAAAYSAAICSLIGSKDEHYAEWLDYQHIGHAQSTRIVELKAAQPQICCDHGADAGPQYDASLAACRCACHI